jgi:hypothetical protein
MDACEALGITEVIDQATQQNPGMRHSWRIHMDI